MHAKIFVVTLSVASLMSSTRVYSLRNSWWLPLELVKISTPSRPMRMCGLMEYQRMRHTRRQSALLPCRSEELFA